MYRTATFVLTLCMLATGAIASFAETIPNDSSRLLGDFDSDGDRDGDDVDALAASGDLSVGFLPGPNQLKFDLDLNNWIDIYDLIAWLDLGTVDRTGASVEDLILGDANLDGDVNREDLSILNNSIVNPPPLPGKYTCGDFDGDGDYDSQDLWIWFRASLFH